MSAEALEIIRYSQAVDKGVERAINRSERAITSINNTVEHIERTLAIQED